MNGDSRSSAGVAPTRRTVLKALGVGAGLAGFGTSLGVAQSTEPWSVVALPDTQRYAIGWVNDEHETNYALEQTEWIAENAEAENIAFVSHVGDVVQRAFITQEWEYMDDAMSVLDEVVPYSTVPGNHDWEENFQRDSSIENYVNYFGPSRHEGRDYFGGAGPDGLNTYQLFSAGGYDFLHLALEWETPGDVSDPSTALGWAQEVLDRYPARPTILTTHSYLRDEPEGRPEEVQEADGDGNSGQTVWEELVAPNSQVFMVLCGHWTEDDGEAYQVSANDDNEAVYELLADYQDRDDGGHGLLRQVQFRPGEGDPDRIDVRTYSPVTGEEEDSDSEFGFDLDFDARFGGAAADDGPLKGDADGDGDVDGDDVDRIQQSVAGEDVDVDSETADVDGDGDVDIGDAISTRNISEDRS